MHHRYCEAATRRLCEAERLAHASLRKAFASRLHGVLVVFALAVVNQVARAESGYPITVKNVRVGFPAGPFVNEKDESGQPITLFKAGKWSPIEVTLGYELSSPLSDTELEVIVGMPDCDDLIGEVRQRIPVPKNERGEALMVPPLSLKPGSLSTEVTIQVRGVPSGKLLAEPYRQRLTALSPSRYLILSVGSSMESLSLPRKEAHGGETDSLGNPWVQLAVADERTLTNHWFDLDAVDLLVLQPRVLDFIQQDLRKLKAIAEWTRRGGRLLISRSAARAIQTVKPVSDLVPATLGDDRGVSEIALVLPSSPRFVFKDSQRSRILLQRYQPIAERPFLTRLLSDEREEPVPLVVQSTYGLGRVTLVAFDLDIDALGKFPQRDVFWEWLLNVAGSRLPSGSEPIMVGQIGDDDDKYITRQQNNLEFFEGIPVVSFGWVAILILLYLLVIGPLEYLVLKRLLKRMELTWLTFPIIVATICGGTALAAMELKGTELRINKVDLVEIDLTGERGMTGQTWFTVFSPKIQSTPIVLEPNWNEGSGSEVVLSWFGKVKNARQSLFRRTYAYADEYSRLENVPLQVWSTKSFKADWATMTAKPLMASTLRMAEADSNQITGSITSHLPMELLEGAQLIYRDRITPVPPLLKGVPRFLSTSSQGALATSWLQNAMTQKDLIPASRSARAAKGEFEDDPRFELWPLLFHELVQGQFNRGFNVSNRELDQSWRVGEKSPHEAILIARIGRKEGPAEAIMNAPSSPSRLRLNGIESGKLRQETYIRVFIPIGK